MSATVQVVPVWLTIFSTLGLGSFVVSIVTLYISSRQRRREWLLDSKKQEWRELIGTLARCIHYIQNNPPGYLLASSAEQQKGVLQANTDARSVIEDRIVIAHHMQSGNILERWQLTISEGDFSAVANHWYRLHADLVNTARKDCELRS
jgi:hypothetical protein